jgi:hypothetical protein
MTRLPLVGFVAALAVVFVATAMLMPGAAEAPQGTVRVLARLDEYTRQSNPRITNTLTTFLLHRGQLGALPAQSVASPDGEIPVVPLELETRVYKSSEIVPIDEAELKKGFCTATLTQLVRQQFPGSYDSLSDEELENTLLENRPEYKDKVCVFPVWVTTDPHNIIKYEVVPDGPLAVKRMRWLRAGLMTALAGVVGFVALRRFLIPDS